MLLDDRTSLREAVNNSSAVVLTGGSSDIGKSFIKLTRNVRRDLSICNLSHRSPGMFSEELNLRHVPCDFSRRGQANAGEGRVLSILNREVPEGRVLLVNNSGYGSRGPLLEADLGKELGIIEANLNALVEVAARLLTTLTARGCALVKRASAPLAFQPGPFLATYGPGWAVVINRNRGLREKLRGGDVRWQIVCSGPAASGFGVNAGSGTVEVPVPLGHTPNAVVRISLRALPTLRTLVVRGWRIDLVEVFASCLPRGWWPACAGKSIDRAQPLEVAR